MGKERESLTSINPVVVAIDQDEFTEEILRFVREGGGVPYLKTHLHDAYNALMELPGQPILIVRYQLEGKRNMGGRLLEKIKRCKILLDVPTIVFNNHPTDTAVNDLCYSYYNVNHVICENELWSHIALIRRIRDEIKFKRGAFNMLEFESQSSLSKIFIVHRHNHSEKRRISQIIYQMMVEPIVLPGEATLSKTVIEAIEHLSDVSCGIVLLTADDYCSENPEGKFKSRARQNVIFEAGFLMGKLKRERVILLHQDDVELPSDLKGVLCIPLSLSDDKLTLRFHQIFDELKIPHKIKTY